MLSRDELALVELYRQAKPIIPQRVWVDDQYSDRMCEMDLQMLPYDEAWQIASLFVMAPKLLSGLMTVAARLKGRPDFATLASELESLLLQACPGVEPYEPEVKCECMPTGRASVRTVEPPADPRAELSDSEWPMIFEDTTKLVMTRKSRDESQELED